ncbi:MAG: radical SAM protein [Candidatus Eremiobacteraeota bacterium]|nr:radical SAM protein [Candidatus Eremiobacteraeota bacterium]
MKDIYVHSDGEQYLSRVMLHGEREEEGRTVSIQVYPGRERTPAPPPMAPLAPEHYLCWNPGLFMAPRGRETLIVEPESAQWIVLDERYYSLFSLARPVTPFFMLSKNPFAPPEETEQFFYFLLCKNIVQRKDWPLLFPPVMPSPLHYPSFFSIHVTESCNFRCTYCYGDAPSRGKKMKKETLRAIIDGIFLHFSRQDVTIEFHGGEPLLARGLIEAGCRQIRELWKAKPHRRFRILIQTNGSLITSEDIDFFREHDISVGVSMDGPREIHDRNRVYHGGKGTFRDTMRGFSLLRSHGIEGGVLAVVEEPRDYVPVARFLLEIGVTGFRLNHMVCQGRGEVDPLKAHSRGEAFAREYLELVDFLDEYGKAHREERLDVWPVNIMLFHLAETHRPFMCMRSPCGAGSHGLGFDYRGDIYPCEQLAGFGELRVGSIFDKLPLDELLGESPVIKTLRERRVERIEKCCTCPWRNFCGGGCAAESFSCYHDLAHEDLHCTFYRRTFENLMWELHRRGDLTHLMGQFGRQRGYGYE